MPRSNKTVPNGAARSAARTVHRCAIYTRKSSEEGLEQEFNSLDAQGEACEAFILSQKHTGWVALPDLYDDSGLSGGTLERPALIGAGRVDTVVVYKVDRLTRSLADFAKIVEAFDARGVAFVSVTQQFNTTSSMGRLTLNMLLSFAQFECEVTGERIRDKVAASKQKGMWMGGLAPLGYDAQDRKLVVNASEAETVRHIFERYAALKSVRLLKAELDAAGIRSKSRTDRLGNPTGARPLARGALYGMLQNPLYRGEIEHKGAVYPGQHAAIIDAALWDRVQSCLGENRVNPGRGDNATTPSLLTGLVYNGAGERMSPTHANKKGTRYRYYASQSLIQNRRGEAPAAACRVPAAELEGIVESRIRALLQDEAAIYDVARSVYPDPASRRALLVASADLARTWPSLAAPERRAMLQALIARVTVRAEAVEIEVAVGALPGTVQPDAAPGRSAPDLSATVLVVPANIKRSRQRMMLVQAEASTRQEPDRKLLRLLAQAHQFAQVVNSARAKDMDELAADAGVSPSYFTRVLRLAFLAPDITKAILQGRQPASLTAHTLRLAGRLSPGWSEQRRQLRL